MSKEDYKKAVQLKRRIEEQTKIKGKWYILYVQTWLIAFNEHRPQERRCCIERAREFMDMYLRTSANVRTLQSDLRLLRRNIKFKEKRNENR